MRIAYIDHSFHERTRSTWFLVELLRKYAQVDVFWDDKWKGDHSRLKEVIAGRYDAILLFQVFDHSNYGPLKKSGIKKITLVPMYGDIVNQSGFSTNHYWSCYSYAKFLNFSKKLHDQMSRAGLKSKFIQYFPPVPIGAHMPTIPNKRTSELNAFFWQRTDRITWHIIKCLVGDTKLNKFHIHSATDPGRRFIRPNEDDIERYQITISDWFEKKEEYLKLVLSSDIYFAPRLYEGIGQSFLEALVAGKCVVAPNHPTMNEYIQHEVTGYLYDPTHPTPLNFSNIQQIMQNARERCQEGRELWLSQEKEIANFILDEKVDFSQKHSVYYKVWKYNIYHILTNPGSVVRKLKKYF